MPDDGTGNFSGNNRFEIDFDGFKVEEVMAYIQSHITVDDICTLDFYNSRVETRELELF